MLKLKCCTTTKKHTQAWSTAWKSITQPGKCPRIARSYKKVLWHIKNFSAKNPESISGHSPQTHYDLWHLRYSTIGFGPGNEVLAHAPNERVPISDLVAATAFYTASLMKYNQIVSSILG